MITLEYAESDLRWIESTVAKLRANKKAKRDAFSLPFTSSTVVDDMRHVLENGDSWYESLRANECKASSEYCGCSKPRHVRDPERNPERNMLYDEAEYQPLSKFEQDSDRILKKDPRSVNYNSEIKLKISEKMQNLGYSSALPSDLYGKVAKTPAKPVEIPVPNREEQFPNMNLFKRDPGELKRTKRSTGDTNFEKYAKTYKIESHPSLTINGEEIRNPRNTTAAATEDLVEQIKSLHDRLEGSSYIEESEADEELIYPEIEQEEVIRESRNSR